MSITSFSEAPWVQYPPPRTPVHPPIRRMPGERLEVRLIVPGDQRPARELDAVDVPALAVLEDRDPRVGVRDAVDRRQVLRPEGVAEQRRAEEEVQEAPVRDAEDALAPGGQPRLHAQHAAQDLVEGLGA